MSEMIERVARAICKAECQEIGCGECRQPCSEWKSCGTMARAAIEAIREPTTAMVAKGAEWIVLPKGMAEAQAKDMFRAMIDAALHGEG